MGTASGYGQFCPVAKAAEIVTTRWTPLVLRELISGSCRFNEIHRGVPLMSRALLARRLRDLERARIIERDSARSDYRLTAAGEALRPIIVALGAWGQAWLESALESDDWDAGVLMWDVRRRIDPSALPARKTVLQFAFADAPPELGLWWLVIESDEVDLCQSDPGFPIDLTLASRVSTLARVWIGHESLRGALEAERILLMGDEDLRASLPRWFRLSLVAEAARAD